MYGHVAVVRGGGIQSVNLVTLVYLSEAHKSMCPLS